MKRLVILLSFFLLFACDGPDKGLDYRKEMIDFVSEISAKARALDSDFVIIPQNGQEILDFSKENEVPLSANSVYVKKYFDAIDGVGREDIFYGYSKDGVKTPERERAYFKEWCDFYRDNSKVVLGVDYFTSTSSTSDIDESYSLNDSNSYISFAATERLLTNIPSYPSTPYNMNSDDIEKLSDAKNFLYLINGEDFSSKEALLDAIRETAYDVVIMDCFFNEELFSNGEIESLKIKGDSDGDASTNTNGGKRLVVSYMSIGEAEDYRFYWQKSWKLKRPDWLKRENPNWEGNYKVKYWKSGWKDVILNDTDGYLKKVLDSGFDGVYLDIIDAFEYFE